MTRQEAIEMLENKGWIPCGERMPETKEWRTTFIVTVHCDSWEKDEVMSMEWENETVRGKDVSRWVYKNRLLVQGWEVIAWQPLPEPYKENE